ncbi:MAG: polysaccharide pyruvyl transferase family protein [Patescibacteria group bacterium]
MKFLHLANFYSTNIGNGALIFGTERVLREDIHPDIEFVPEPWDEYVIENALGPRKFDAGFADLVNRHDALLVGGAVTFNGRAHLADAGMRLNLPLRLWQEIRKPVIFYGNAARFWPGQTYHHRDRLRDILAYLGQRPDALIGVRNDGTKHLLESLVGFASDRIVSLPDPGLFVPAVPGEYPEIAKGKINIAVALNNEDEASRFPDPEKKQRFLNAFCDTLDRLSRTWDLNLVFVPHHFDDYKIIAECVALLPPALAHQRSVSCGLVTVPHTPYFYGRYAQMDLALSMRIHSLSPAIGLGVPVVPLVSQQRMSAFLDDMGLADMGLDIFDLNFAEKFYAAAHRALSDAVAARQRLRGAADAARERTRVFNREIRRLLPRG